MNAKYRAPAIASDLYALLKIGATAIRKLAVDHKSSDRSRGFPYRAESFRSVSTVISSTKTEDCTQFGKQERSDQFVLVMVVVKNRSSQAAKKTETAPARPAFSPIYTFSDLLL